LRIQQKNIHNFQTAWVSGKHPEASASVRIRKTIQLYIFAYVKVLAFGGKYIHGMILLRILKG